MFGNKDKTSKNNITTLTASGKQIDTLISQDCEMQGDINTANSIKIDGKITGNLNAAGLAIIGETGFIKGDVKADDLLIIGKLEGNIFAKRLHLQNTAYINGNIETETLQVDAGAKYFGSVNMKENLQNSQNNPALLEK